MTTERQKELSRLDRVWHEGRIDDERYASLRRALLGESDQPMTDTKVITDFVDWLRREGYFMKKVNELGNERFVPTQELVEQYRLSGGLGR